MAERPGILVLNQVSAAGLARLPAEQYRVGKDVADPVAILVRSADLHGVEIAPSVRAIGRAGVGTNNIPVEAMSRRGVPVFNAPGANANAVKELVLAGMGAAVEGVASGGQVGAGAERAPGAGDDDDAHRVVRIGLVEQRLELQPHPRVVGVELVGTIEGDRGDALIDFVARGFERRQWHRRGSSVATAGGISHHRGARRWRSRAAGRPLEVFATL